MDVFVDPDVRGYRIGQRLYNARKKLCQDWRLKGIVFGGRLPTLHRQMRRYDSFER
jgi:GNAT superfamily N-acetyltransferase